MRKPRPTRPMRMIGDIPHYLCGDCGRAGDLSWKPVTKFRRLCNPKSRCGIVSVCKKHEHARRVERDRRARNQAREVKAA